MKNQKSKTTTKTKQTTTNTTKKKPKRKHKTKQETKKRPTLFFRMIFHIYLNKKVSSSKSLEHNPFTLLN